MRIFVTGDIHFHEPLGREEQERYVDHILDEAAAAAPNLVLLLGDYVRPAHASRATPWERNLIRHLANGLTESIPGEDTRTVALRGNHDIPGDLDHLRDIQGIRYCDEPTVMDIDTGNGEVRLFALPWQDTKDGQDILQLLDFWRAQLASGRPNVVAMHGAVAGSTKESGQPMITSEFQIPPDALSGFDLVLASHYHCAQATKLDCGTTIVLPGSPWPHAVNEGRQQGKGPQIWSLELQGGRWVPILQQTIVVPYAPRYAYTLAWSEQQKCLVWPDQTSWTGIPMCSASPVVPSRDDLRGSRVTVKVLRPATAKAVADRKGIEDEFLAAGCLDVTVDVVPMVTAAPPRIPEINRERLGLFDMIELVRAKEGRPITERERYLAELAACGGSNALSG